MLLELRNNCDIKVVLSIQFPFDWLVIDSLCFRIGLFVSQTAPVWKVEARLCEARRGTTFVWATEFVLVSPDRLFLFSFLKSLLAWGVNAYLSRDLQALWLDSWSSGIVSQADWCEERSCLFPMYCMILTVVNTHLWIQN